jgi:hypothetical protein
MENFSVLGKLDKIKKINNCVVYDHRMRFEIKECKTLRHLIYGLRCDRVSDCTNKLKMTNKIGGRTFLHIKSFL